jgi:hypothetical protein
MTAGGSIWTEIYPVRNSFPAKRTQASTGQYLVAETSAPFRTGLDPAVKCQAALGWTAWHTSLSRVLFPKLLLCFVQNVRKLPDCASEIP